VLVNAIAPAMVETELQAQMTQEHIQASKAKIPMGRFLQTEEVAAMVSWIAGPECSFTTGFTFDLSGGRATY
jgi:3-oxoacyl-[acyl-carrier protein] reductase